MVGGYVFAGVEKQKTDVVGSDAYMTTAELYRKVLVHVLEGTVSVGYGYMDADGNVYRLKSGVLTLVNEANTVYEIDQAVVGKTTGSVISIKNLEDPNWENNERCYNDVNLPEYAYINGVSYKVVEIGEYGFQGSKVKSITVSGNVTTVAKGAFKGSEHLSEVYFEDSVVRLGADIFAECDSLTTVSIGQNVATIDGNLFSDRKYTLTKSGSDYYIYTYKKVGGVYERVDLSVSISENNQHFVAKNQMILSKDGSVLYALYGIGGDIVKDELNPTDLSKYRREVLGKVVADSKIKSISFELDESLGISVIKEGAFRSAKYAVGTSTAYIGITDVVLPSTVRALEAGAFDYMPDLASVTIGGEPTDMGYDEDTRLTVFGVENEENTKAHSKVFTVLGIEGSMVETYCAAHGFAYRAVVAVDNFYVSEYKVNNVTTGIIITGVADKSKVKSNMIIPAYLTYNDTEYPVKAIGRAAFYGISAIKTLVLPDTITEVGNSAFAELRNLQTAIFLGSGGTIANLAFAYDTALKEVHFCDDPDEPDANVTNIFKGCNRNLVIYTTFPDFFAGQQLDGTHKVAGKLIEKTTADASTTVVASDLNKNETVVTDIKSGATAAVGGKYKGEVDLPKYIRGAKVVGIDIAAFSLKTGGSAMTKLTIPDSVRYIAGGSFADATALSEVVLPSSVKLVGANAFKMVRDDFRVYLNGNVELDGVAFSANKTVTIYASSNIRIFVKTASGAYFSGFDQLGNEITGKVDADGNPVGVSVTDYCRWMNLKGGNCTYIPVVYSDTAYFETEIINGLEIEITGVTDLGKAEKYLVVPRYINGYKVTTLGDGALAHCDNLVNVSLPEDLTAIGDYVFVGTFENVTAEEKAEYVAKYNATSYYEVTFRNPSCDFLLFISPIGDYRMITNSKKGDNPVGDKLENVTHIYAVLPTTTATTYSLKTDVVYIAEGAFAGSGIESFSGSNSHGYSVYKSTALVRDKVTLLAVSPIAADANVPAGITTIGAYAYYNFANEAVTSINLGNLLSEVGEGAFEGAKYVANYQIGSDSLLEIAARTFYGNKALKSMPYIASLRVIGAGAFAESGLTDLNNMPDDLFTISAGAFSGCTALKEIALPANVTHIGEGAFRGCINLSSFTMSNEVEYIGAYAFAETGLETISLPEAVTEIAEGLFADATALTSIEAEGQITSIGEAAFRGATSLTGVPAALMDTVAYLGEYAFAESGIRSITIGQLVTEVPAYAFYKCKYLTDVSLPATITSIGDHAFDGCNGKADASIEGLTVVFDYRSSGTPVVNVVDENEETVRTHVIRTIRNNNVYVVVDGYELRVFGGRMTVGGKVTKTTEVKYEDGTKALVAEVGDMTVRYYEGKLYVTGGSTLNVGWGVTDVQFGINVTTIGEFAFADCSLTGLLIADGVETIGRYAFRNNVNLQSVEIGGSLEKMGDGVFSGAVNLAVINVSSRNTTFTNMGDGVLYSREIDEYTGLYTGNVILNIYPAGLVPSTADGAYVLPDNTVAIMARAFEYSKLVSVNIPDSVREIGEGAFAGASQLSSVFFDGDVERLGSDIFDGVSFRYYWAADGIYVWDENFDFVSLYEAAADGAYALENGKFNCLYSPVANGAFVFVDGEYVAYTATNPVHQGRQRYTRRSPLAGAARYNKRYDLEYVESDVGDYIKENGVYTSVYTEDEEGGYVLGEYGYERYDESNPAHADVTRYSIRPVADNVKRYAKAERFNLNNLVVDVPADSNLYDAFKGLDGYYCLDKGVDVTSCDALGIVVTEHTAKADFVYVEEDKVTIKGLASTFRSDVLVVPAFINGKVVAKIGDFAFRDAGITNFVMGRYVESIGQGILYGNRLTDVSVAAIPNADYNGWDDSEPYFVNEHFRVAEGNAEDGAPYKTLVGTVSGLNTLIVYLVNNTAERFVLPKDIASIGYGAFAYNGNLKHVELHDDLGDIAPYAFAYCDKLGAKDDPTDEEEVAQPVVIPRSVGYLAEGVFAGDVALTAVYAYTGTAIAARAFSGCLSLTDIGWYTSSGEGVLYVDGNYMFDGDNGLLYAYEDSRWTLHTFLSASRLLKNGTVILPEQFAVAGTTQDAIYDITAIGAYAFEGATDDLEKLVVTYNPKDRNVLVGEGAFVGSAITEFHFEGIVNAYYSNVFDAGVKKVYLPFNSPIGTTLSEGVRTYVSNRYDLSYEASADTVTVVGLSTAVTSKDVVIPYYVEGKEVVALADYAATGDAEKDNKVVAFAGSDIRSLTLLDNVDAIPESYFAGCAYLHTVDLSKSEIEVISAEAFLGCTSLASVSLPTGITAIGDRAFAGDAALTTLPEHKYRNLQSVGDYAFANTGLVRIDLWAGVKNIGAYAFANTEGKGKVKTLDVIYSVESIGEGAFQGHPDLKYVHFQGHNDESLVATKPAMPEGKHVFDKVDGIQVKIPANATALYDYFVGLGYVDSGDNQNLFLYTPASYFVKTKVYDEWGNEGYVLDGIKAAYKNEVTRVYFPDQIEGLPVVGVSSGFGATLGAVTLVEFNTDLATIGEGAFKGVATLATVVFGTKNASKLVSIGDYAFFGTAVAKLTLRSEVLDTIGAYAFANTALTSVEIERVVNIGDFAFAKVDTVESEGKLVATKVNEDAALKTVDVNVDGGSVGRYAFAYKTAFEDVNLDGSIDTIGEGAFAWSNLTADTMPTDKLVDYVRHIGAFAFANTNVVKVPANVETIGRFAFARGLLVNGATGTMPYAADGVYGVTAVNKDTLATTLDKVTINSAVRVEEGAFSGTSITSLSMGAGLMYFAASRYETDDLDAALIYGALEETVKLQKITVVEGDCYVVKKGALYRYDDLDAATLIKYPAAGDEVNMVTKDALSVSLLKVGTRAFVGANVKTVKLHADRFAAIEREAFMGTGITLLQANGVTSVGTKAFYGCTALVDLTMKAGKVNEGSTDLTEDALHVGVKAFEGCTSLVSVSGLTGAGWYDVDSFKNTGVTVLVLSNMVVRIDEGAFNKVTALVIPDMLYAAAVSANAFAANVKVYYMADEYVTVSAYGESISNGIATTGAKVSYNSDDHFNFKVVDGKYHIESFRSGCAGHDDYHNGKELFFAPYWNYNGVLYAVTTDGSYTTVTPDGTYTETVTLRP